MLLSVNQKTIPDPPPPKKKVLQDAAEDKTFAVI